MDKKDFNIEKKRLKEHMIMISIFLLLLFVVILLIGLSAITPKIILENKNVSIDALGGFGSYMNLLISMTSTITVILVFYGVRMQGLEFKAMNKALKQEERSNRTMELISKWNSFEKTIEDESRGALFVENEKLSFVRNLKIINDSALKDKIDTDIILTIVANDFYFLKSAKERYSKNEMEISLMAADPYQTFRGSKLEKYLNMKKKDVLKIDNNTLKEELLSRLDRISIIDFIESRTSILDKK